MSDYFWTPERTSEMVRRWEAGENGDQIAVAMKAASRSAVLGKIHRMKRQGHEFARVARHDDYTTRVRIARMGGQARWAGHRAEGPKRLRATNNLAAVNAARRAAGTPRPLPEPSAIVDATHAKPWLERGFGECAYPISGEGADTFSCCAPTKYTYCKAHWGVMYDRTKGQSPTPKSNPVGRSRLAPRTQFNDLTNHAIFGT